MKGAFTFQASRNVSGLRVAATNCQDGKANLFNNSLVSLVGEVMAIVTVAMDLAKNIFAGHGIDEGGKATLVRQEIPRAKLAKLIANMPPSV